MNNFARYLFILAFACFSIGCAVTSKSNAQRSGFDDLTGDASNSTAVLTPKRNVSQELVKQGIVYLREGNYEDAQKVFSAAIKVNPNNSTIHVLNGISYHLEFINGAPDSKALAETAYGLAGTLDKLDPLPMVQMGRLHMDAGDHQQAAKDFIAAYALSPHDQDALSGILQTSLLQKDFKTALWAGDKVKALNITSADNQRLLVIMYSAVGQSNEAQKHLDAYAKLKADDPKAIEFLRRQVRYIDNQRTQLAELQEGGVPQALASPPSGVNPNPKMIKVANNRGGDASIGNGPGGNVNIDNGLGGATGNRNSGNGSTGNRNLNSAVNSNTARTSDSSRITNPAGAAAAYGLQQQNSSDDSSSSSSGTASAPMPAASGGSAGAPATSGGGGGGTYSAVSMSNQSARWFDCDTKPGLGKAPGGSYGVPVGGTSGDQTLYLEPLPVPCANNSPKMASIDAVLIRTVDVMGSSYGINLLTGLQIFAGSQRSATTTSTNSGASATLNTNASVIGLGNATSATLNGVSGLLNYTLNIANATSSNTQVVARPTLTALDRIPSTFYSGGVQTVGLNGGGVSGAQVSNVPTGISLSVTPSFIDDETMMLAVKVARSFINAAAPVGGFNAGISVSQHAVTSNVRIKYGETLILDGLTLRTFTSEQDGVPVLQDIPIIQYLFNSKKQQKYSENVLVMITPRKLISNASDLQKMEDALAKKGDQLSPQEKNVYLSIRNYQDLVKGNYPNVDGAIAAMNRDSSYYRQFKMAVISDDGDGWVSQSSMSRFLNNAADLVYFTR